MDKENQIYENSVYLPYYDEFDNLFEYIYQEKYSLFTEPKKINYYRIFSLSHNTTSFLLTHREEIQYIYNNKKHLLKHIFDKEV